VGDGVLPDPAGELGVRTTGLVWAWLAAGLLTAIVVGLGVWVGQRLVADADPTILSAPSPSPSPAPALLSESTTTLPPATSAPPTPDPAPIAASPSPPPPTSPPPTPVIRAVGVEPLRLGMSQGAAKATGAIGGFEEGCTLGDPSELTAPLSPPLRGWATFNGGALTGLSVTGGAVTENGVAPGAPLRVALAAYAARFNVVETALEEMFEIWVFSPFGEEAPYDFVVDPATELIVSVDVPGLRLCE
jgi:hypothetical protein